MPEQYGDRPAAARPGSAARTGPRPPFRGSTTKRDADKPSAGPSVTVPQSPPASAAVQAPATGQPRRSVLQRVVPALIVVGVLAGVLLGSREAIAKGDWMSVAGPLLIVGIIAFNMLRELFRR